MKSSTSIDVAVMCLGVLKLDVLKKPLTPNFEDSQTECPWGTLELHRDNNGTYSSNFGNSVAVVCACKPCRIPAHDHSPP